MKDRFIWYGFDVRNKLPENWQNKIIHVAKSHAVNKIITPKSVTSREHDSVSEILVRTLGGSGVKKYLPWLFDLYTSVFLELGQRCIREKLSTAQDERYAINLNIQQGHQMRYEAHIDTNPLEGILYVTSHSEGLGGELVVGNKLNANGINDIENDNTRIFPVAGHLIFFDARNHSHYVTSLKRDDDIRVVVAMNFYTSSCSENYRPADLNAHLGIDQD